MNLLTLLKKMSRKWKDAKDKELKSGRWTEKEIKHLKRLLCKYASRKNLTPEQLGSLCSDSTPPEFKNVWVKIAKFFPDRSVQSVHNLCKRHFNPNNYKGAWTLIEERQLIEFVKANGKKWKELGDILQRTALNVKDKWKQMGGDHNDLRKTGVWSAEETKELVLLVFKYLALDTSKVESVKIQNEDICLKDLINLISKHRQEIMLNEIGWESVSSVFKTRSSVDCRTRWSYIMNTKVSESMIFTEEEDIFLFKSIKSQRVVKIEDIQFDQIHNGKTEDDNKFRFKVLAKAMSGRLRLSLNEVLEKLEYSYEKAKPVEESQSILEYYLNNYQKTTVEN